VLAHNYLSRIGSVEQALHLYMAEPALDEIRTPTYWHIRGLLDGHGTQLATELVRDEGNYQKNRLNRLAAELEARADRLQRGDPQRSDSRRGHERFRSRSDRTDS